MTQGWNQLLSLLAIFGCANSPTSFIFPVYLHFSVPLAYFSPPTYKILRRNWGENVIFAKFFHAIVDTVSLTPTESSYKEHFCLCYGIERFWIKGAGSNGWVRLVQTQPWLICLTWTRTEIPGFQHFPDPFTSRWQQVLPIEPFIAPLTGCPSPLPQPFT